MAMTVEKQDKIKWKIATLSLVSIIMILLIVPVGKADLSLGNYVIELILQNGQTQDPFTIKNASGSTLLKIDANSTITINDAGGNPSTVMGPRSGVEAASYIVFTDGTNVYAKNGTTGKIDYQSANATTVAQSAIDSLTSGGIVFFRKGTYSLNINITNSNTVLTGEGHSSILKLNDTSTYLVNLIPGINNTEISNLHFLGGSEYGATKTVIHAGGCSGCDSTYYNTGIKVTNNYFENSKIRAVDVYSARDQNQININNNVIVKNNIFKNNTQNAMYISADNVIVDGNIIHDAPDTAIDGGELISNVVIVNNVVLSSQSGIIMSHYNGYGLISNNVLTNVTANGISISKGTNLNPTLKNFIITGNLVESNSTGGYSGITVSNVSDVLVEGNKVTGFGTQSIKCSYASNTSIINNVVTLPTANYGTYLDGCTNVMIQQNTYYLGAGKGGIYTNRRATVKDNVFYTADTAIKLDTGNANNSVVSYNTLYNTRAGIYITSSGYNKIIGNIFVNSTYNNDIVEETTSDNNRIEFNEVRNKYAVTLTGNNTIIRQNVNYITENKSTASLVDGGKITHGLSKAPTFWVVYPQAINVTTSATADATYIWVNLTYINGTSVTSPINVTWQAEA